MYFNPFPEIFHGDLNIIEIRWHGRGGQGVWTVSNFLAEAAIKEGKYAQSFPTFGPERMGAPVAAFTRISDEVIEIHSSIYEPDAVVVLDSSLIGYEDFISGLKDGGILLVSDVKLGLRKLSEIVNHDLSKYKVYTLPASELALKYLRRAVTNTAMLGALVRVLPIVKLETVVEVIRERFRGVLAEANVSVVKAAYEEVVPLEA